MAAGGQQGRWWAYAPVLVALLGVAVIQAAPNPPDARGTPPPRSMVLVGDSVTAGNVTGVRAALDARGITDYAIHARGDRQIELDVLTTSGLVKSGVATVAQVRDAGVDSDLWVVSLGTNELPRIRRCGCDQVAYAVDLIGLMREAIGPRRRIAWVTVQVNYDGMSEVFNTALREVAASDPTFSIIDWYTYSEGQPWFLDGVHPNFIGATRLSALIASCVATLLAAGPPTPPTTTSTAPPSTASPPSTADDLGPATAHEPAVRIPRATVPVSECAAP